MFKIMHMLLITTELKYMDMKTIKIFKAIRFYVGAIRTLNSKYQKFMTCQLVNNIEFEKYIGDKT